MRCKNISKAKKIRPVRAVAMQEDDKRPRLALTDTLSTEPQLAHQITPSRSFATR